MGGIIELIKATRIQRTLTALAVIMVPVGFVGKITSDIVYLAFILMLVYAAASLQNAKKDNDYQLPKYYMKFYYAFVALAVVLSFKNIILFLTLCSWIVLGLIYNTIARGVLFGDVTLLSITHHALPAFSASLLLGLNLRTTLLISALMFTVFWFIIPLKNLKDTIDDRNRGYKTLTTDIKNGEVKTKALFEIAFIVMLGAYFVLNLSDMYLMILLAIFGLKVMINYFIDIRKEEIALNMTRLMAIMFLAAMVIDRTDSLPIILVSLGLSFVYSLFFISSIVEIRKEVIA